MTMPNDPHFHDELLTRYLDGGATDDEITRVESDPDLIARAEQLRTTINIVASPITIPTAGLDRIRATAIAEYATTPVVSELDTFRSERQQKRNRILAAAAVCVLLAVGFGAVQRTLNNDTGNTSANATFDIVSQSDADTAAAEALSVPLDDTDDASTGLADTTAEEGSDDIADEAGADAVPETDHAKASGDAAAEANPRWVFDILPDDLGEVADLAELGDRLSELKETAEAEGRLAPPPPDPFDDLCVPALELLVAQLPGGVTAVETASVVIAGVPQQVSVATGLTADSIVAVLIADEVCEVLEVVDIPGIDSP